MSVSGSDAQQPDVLQINGEAADKVSVLERGLHYGDGVFETLRCHQGRVLFLADHLARLQRGCAQLDINFTDIETLREELTQLASLSVHAMFKVIVSRGIAQSRGYAASGTEHATRIVLRYPTAAYRVPRPGKVGVATMRLSENVQLAGIKHLNRLENVLAQRERLELNCDEMLLLNARDEVICGSMSNVFAVRAGQLLTPRIDTCGVAGVLRQQVRRLAQQLDIPYLEQPMTIVDMNSVDELFLTNVRVGIWSVASLDQKRLLPGQLVPRLQTAFLSLLQKGAEKVNDAS
jgi:4-amino-4-deoxychorismate lyase